MSIKKKIALPALLAVLLFVATVAAPAAGLSQASAAEFPNDEFLEDWNKIPQYIESYGEAWELVRGFRNEIRNWTNDEIGGVLAPLVNALELNVDEKNQLISLFRDLANLSYDSQASELDEIRTKYNAFIQQIVTRINPAVNDLTINEIYEFTVRLKDETLGRIRNLSIPDLINLLNNSQAQLQFVQDTLNKVIDELENNDVSVILSNNDVYNATISVLRNIQSKLFQDSGGGGLPGGGGGGVGGGGVGAPLPLPALNDLNNKIDELKNKLATATPAEKQQLIKQAISAAIETIQSLNAFDPSMKSVSNGTVTINAGGDQLKNVINELAKAINKLKEFLKAAGAEDQAPAFVLTIDVGAVSESNIDFRLAADIVKLATDTGLAGVALRANGLGATIPLGGEFSGEIRFKVGSKDASEANVATSLKLASKVYDFALSVNGRPLTEFEQPILIRIPLINLSGVDKELLSVAKIVDGKFVFYGGYVEGDAIVEARDTFSSYVVVENKVAFNDTGRVQSWAGRQIEVMAAKGAIEGKAAGVFAPHDNVTRAEFAKMLVKALDLEHAKATENFADVKATDWFAPYVAAAVKHGIIQGRSSTVFDPHAKITRAEMATMIARALKVKYNLKGAADPDAALRFSDADRIPAALKDGVAFAAENGLILGYQGKFNPNDNATRAEAAVVLYRTFHFKV